MMMITIMNLAEGLRTGAGGLHYSSRKRSGESRRTRATAHTVRVRVHVNRDVAGRTPSSGDFSQAHRTAQPTGRRMTRLVTGGGQPHSQSVSQSEVPFPAVDPLVGRMERRPRSRSRPGIRASRTRRALLRSVPVRLLEQPQAETLVVPDVLVPALAGERAVVRVRRAAPGGHVALRRVVVRAGVVAWLGPRPGPGERRRPDRMGLGRPDGVVPCAAVGRRGDRRHGMAVGGGDGRDGGWVAVERLWRERFVRWMRRGRVVLRRLWRHVEVEVGEGGGDAGAPSMSHS
ncbi:hypothetical protein C8Q80DRAFT_844383 [Daedaleopsis nitida]|nr:hypothetical protein C8Q80DRAFT_844383 [Daedaleopsis nitida]